MRGWGALPHYSYRTMPTKSTKKAQKAESISLDVIERRILALRGHSVMFDRDLAMLYGVETRTLNQAVKRNLDRFPADFMFRLSPKRGSGTSAFKITICDLETRPERQISALRVHRTWCCNAGERTQECPRSARQHSSRSRLRKDPAKSRFARTARQAVSETRW